jgi:hypothetical protein
MLARRRFWALALLLLACGSRTGLLIDEELETPPTDGGGPRDGGTRRDGSIRDASEEPLPLIDATPRPDVVRNDCPDAAATLIYVVTEQNELYSFYPTTATFTQIGLLACPSAGGNPFSMAVDRKGTAYVVFQDVIQSPNGTQPGPGDGELFRVSTATGACIKEPFQQGQQGVYTFGMGFASDTNGPNETLFIATDNLDNQTAPASLGTINVTSFALSILGPFAPPIKNAELTGTGDGRLFAFYAVGAEQSPPDSAIGEIDKTTGKVIAETPLPGLAQGQAWAFGFWGGDFYTFTSPQGATGSTVTRVRPSDGSVTTVGSLGSNIVGAGVSTCAPEQ